jgi:hypothetical protein
MVELRMVEWELFGAMSGGKWVIEASELLSGLRARGLAGGEMLDARDIINMRDLRGGVEFPEFLVLCECFCKLRNKRVVFGVFLAGWRRSLNRRLETEMQERRRQVPAEPLARAEDWSAVGGDVLKAVVAETVARFRGGLLTGRDASGKEFVEVGGGICCGDGSGGICVSGKDVESSEKGAEFMCVVLLECGGAGGEVHGCDGDDVIGCRGVGISVFGRLEVVYGGGRCAGAGPRSLQRGSTGGTHRQKAVREGRGRRVVRRPRRRQRKRRRRVFGEGVRTSPKVFPGKRRFRRIRGLVESHEEGDRVLGGEMTWLVRKSTRWRA